MFVDEIDLNIKGGHGGPGKVSFAPGFKSGPDGGDGGKGGDVYILVTSDLTTLRAFTKTRLVNAENGQPGMSKRKFGKNGDDLEILMPFGTILTDLDTTQETELLQTGERVLITKGGLGGRGNYEFRSSRNTTPMYAQPGLEGIEKRFHVSLKLIADFGLIGLPNAGKSSLLNELTAANARVADYPFTTLEPNLGVMDGKIIADIPGLIEGASQGKGLGIKFLKHIEKVKVLLHCLSAESTNPQNDYKTVRNELEKFNPDLLTKPEIILITKTDIINDSELSIKLKILRKLTPNILTVSTYDPNSIQRLKDWLNSQ